MLTYYNDIEEYACEWMRNLVDSDDISMGVVDGRSILDVVADELVGYQRIHLFSGIGGWDLALSMSGVQFDCTVLTASCPCQPFSAAGKQKGEKDERHLWPEALRVIKGLRPGFVFGEQVASKLGRTWLSRVQTDLEALGYRFGAADLCAAGIGAPHIRQRLYWGAWLPSVGLAHSEAVGHQRSGSGTFGEQDREEESGGRSSDSGGTGGMANTKCRSAERHGHEVGGTTEGVQGEEREQRVRTDTREGKSVSGMEEPSRTGAGGTDGTPCDEGWEAVDPRAEGIRQGHRGTQTDRVDTGGSDDGSRCYWCGLREQCGLDRIKGPCAGERGDRLRSWVDDPNEEVELGEHGCCSTEIGQDTQGGNPVIDSTSSSVRVGNADVQRHEGQRLRHSEREEVPEVERGSEVYCTCSPWSYSTYIPCRDGRCRRIEPSISPLAARLPRSVGPGSTREQRVELMAAKANRKGRLTGYGNSIVPQLGAVFVRSFIEAIKGGDGNEQED
jgi:site-specific DNA-cytosine methylase